jgi:hypothetical protein
MEVHQDIDLASTGEADAGCHLIGDAVVEEGRWSAVEHSPEVLVKVSFDAPAGDRPRQLSGVGYGEASSGGTRGRTVHPHERGHCGPATLSHPAIQRFADFLEAHRNLTRKWIATRDVSGRVARNTPTTCLAGCAGSRR